MVAEDEWARWREENEEDEGKVKIMSAYMSGVISTI
jgi:hypothetical protein